MSNPQGRGATASEDIHFTASSGNVFADLGLDKPELELAKATATFDIIRAIEDAGWTESEAAALLGLDPSHLSALPVGHFGGLSIRRLRRLATLARQCSTHYLPDRHPSS